MKYLILLVLYGFTAIPAFSQKIPYNETISYVYFDSSRMLIPGKTGAAYVRVFMGIHEEKDVYEVRDYTLDGTLLVSWHSASKRTLLPHGLTTWYNQERKPVKKGYYNHGSESGQWTTYYPNGRMKKQYTVRTDSTLINLYQGESFFRIDNTQDSTGQPGVINGNGWFRENNDSTGRITEEGLISNGLKDSIWTGYDHQGNITYTETYKAGTLVHGSSPDAEGQWITYTVLIDPPVFPGGERGLNNFMRRHIRFPKEARVKGYAGKVGISFVVNESGDVTDIKVENSIAKILDEEAIRVIRMMPQWKPGKVRGKIAPVGFLLPVDFSLR